MAKRGSIARDSAFDSAAQVLVMLFSLVAGVVLARTLGDSGRGAYVLATSFAGGLMLSLTNLGFELSASVLVAKRRALLPRVHTIIFLGSALMGALLVSLALAAGPIITTYILPGIDMATVLLVFCALPFWIYQHGCYGILIGLGQIKVRSKFDVAYNFLQNLLVVVLLVMLAGQAEGEVVRWLAMAYYAMIALSAFAIARTVARFGPLWRWPGFRLVRRFFRYGFWVYLGNMGGNVGARIDQYALQQGGAGTASFGVYTLATSLTQRTRVFPQALSRASYARICSSAAPEAARIVAACFRQMFALGVILVAVGAIFSPLIPIVYTSDFAPAILPFIIFLFGRLFHNCSWMLSNWFTGHLARPRIAMVVNWAVLPVQAVLALAAVRMGGLVALSIAASAGYMLVFAIFLVMFLRSQKHVTASDLFLIGWRDIEPWVALLMRRRKAK